MKRCLGVDQSKSQTGVTRADIMTTKGPSFNCKIFKVKAPGPVSTLDTWYRYMRLELDGQVKPDIVAYELPVIVNTNNMILYQLSGMLIHMCLRRDIYIIGVNTSTVKRWAGVTDKGKPMDYACALLGRTKMTSDEADSAVLCEIAYYVANEDTDPGTDVKREIVRKLRRTEKEAQEEKAAGVLASAQRRVDAEADKKQSEFDKFLRERKRELAKQERERAQEARRVARELRAAETLRKRTEAAQRRQEREEKKKPYLRLEEMK